jgi:Tfp pilus assembly protein FimV
MGFADTASYYLEIAAMLQDIPNKRGEILLDLAQAYKIIGESDLAKRACQEILEINCGAREKSQAQKLLTELADKKQERK